jgi:hypothetical protein
MKSSVYISSRKATGGMMKEKCEMCLMLGKLCAELLEILACALDEDKESLMEQQIRDTLERAVTLLLPSENIQ